MRRRRQLPSQHQNLLQLQSRLLSLRQNQRLSQLLSPLPSQHQNQHLSQLQLRSRLLSQLLSQNQHLSQNLLLLQRQPPSLYADFMDIS